MKKLLLALMLLVATMTVMAKTRVINVDAKKSTNQKSLVFQSVNEALKYVEQTPVKYWTDIHIAPAVYWIDDPDDETIHRALPGDRAPFGLKVKMDRVRMIGDGKSPDDVILASRRGQTQGAVGNFTMFFFEGSDIEARNLTFGNYCNVDLEYKLDPSQNRPKRNEAIVQAQLIICDGDRYSATDCRFISRLNLCPFAGAKHAEFLNCYFECTDDALCGTGTYRNCGFTFFSSKPFYATSPGGAHFYDCDIHTKVKGTQYLTKRSSLVTMTRCRWTSDDPNLKIEWDMRPSPEFPCTMTDCTLNGKPLVVPTPTEPLPLQLPAFQLTSNQWKLDVYRPSDIPEEHKYTPDTTRPAWGFAQGVDGGDRQWGLMQLQRGARMMLPVDNVRKAILQLCPNKVAGQGFGSATSQYMDVCVAFDCETLTGYGVRFQRVPQYGESVEMSIVEYKDGQIAKIVTPEQCFCYKPECCVTVWVDGDTINAVIEYAGKQHSLNAKMSAPHTSGGFHLQHTGSAGDSSTLIKGIELRP